jgi:hypothetical protein
LSEKPTLGFAIPVGATPKSCASFASSDLATCAGVVTALTSTSVEKRAAGCTDVRPKIVNVRPLGIQDWTKEAPSSFDLGRASGWHTVAKVTTFTKRGKGRWIKLRSTTS